MVNKLRRPQLHRIRSAGFGNDPQFQMTLQQEGTHVWAAGKGTTAYIDSEGAHTQIGLPQTPIKGR